MAEDRNSNANDSRHGDRQAGIEATHRDPLRRYPDETRRAGKRLRAGHRDAASVRTFVTGVLAHHLSSERAGFFRLPNDNLRLSEDLGLDSLSMIEVVMTIEESLGLSVPQDRLRQLRTIGQVVGLIANSKPAASGPSRRRPGGPTLYMPQGGR